MSRIITIEILADENRVYIGEDNSSGAFYEGTTPEDVAYAIECYLQDY